ncbi:hypothetical protein QTP70_016398 [Hemibagrus guttatus]|uniref:Uncharacterized protein n=1 Tax=Hemibagrus guttatus TaxID=175788 RepID=A0AAE0PX97_9TELE|nr:hypothetical protein QTP70_016398 [Hemibagrus guttatus]
MFLKNKTRAVDQYTGCWRSLWYTAGDWTSPELTVPALSRTLVSSGIVMLRELVNVAGSDLSRAEDLAARMGLRSLRVVNQLLHRWRSTLTSEERVQLMDYQHTEAGPAEDESFPRLNIAPDLDGCAGPLLECRSEGEMDFGCVPEESVMVEDVLIALGEKVGFENIISASRMSRAVVVILKEQRLVSELAVNGLVVKDNYVQISPLSTPSAKITISNCPPFLPNEALECELKRFGKMARAFKTISLGCKHPALHHVESFRRQVFMFLESPENTLDISFRVKHEGRTFMIYASTGKNEVF